MKLKDLKIRSQLEICMGIIVALVILLSALAWEQSDQLWLQIKKLNDHPLTVRIALDSISSDILLMHRDMKDLLLCESEQERLSFFDSMDGHEADALRQFNVLFSQYLGSRRDVEDFYNNFVQWKAIRTETTRLMQSGKITEARERTNEKGVGGRHVEAMWKQRDKTSDFARAKATQLYQDAEKLNYKLAHQLGFVSSGIVLLAIIFSWFLLRNIRRPLTELVGVVGRFRSGDLNARSFYASTNEFGVLSAGFNALADTVQAELQSREAASQIADALLREEALQAFCRELLKRLMARTGSQLGAVYLLNEQKTAFDHFESIGLPSVGRASFSATAPEGEFGSALATGEIRHLADIPTNARFTFVTIGGEFQPREILTIPIAGENGIVAVISLATVRSYSIPAIRLVNDVWNLITARLNGVLASERIRAFSERIERQNEELQVQHEELEAQAEELQEQAEELQEQTEELQEQNVELGRQQRAVEEANRLKSQFLSNMSHELRTPLNSVLALSRVLMMQAKSKLSEEEVSYLEVIERNGKNLLRMINEILDLAKIEAGRMDIHPRAFSFGQTLETMLESMMPLAREKQIELCADIAEDLPPLESDELRVSQILQNLLSNAIKFTDAGSVRISVRSDLENMSVQVDDTGIGIAESDLPRIFDEFRQADGSSTRRYEGTGLGLAIARKMAQMLGGEISVSSILGKGSSFTLTLPVAWQNRSCIHYTHTTQLPTGVPPEHKFLPRVEKEVASQNPRTGIASTFSRMLLVEDNEEAIIQVKAVLESAGHAVHIARGGQAAIDYVSHTLPDGIILDLMMPGVDGFAVLEKIRAIPVATPIPVLILTAKDLTPDDLKRLSANQVQQLVQKGDVDRKSLLRKIRVMLGNESESANARRETCIPKPAPDNIEPATSIKGGSHA